MRPAEWTPHGHVGSGGPFAGDPRIRAMGSSPSCCCQNEESPAAEVVSKQEVGEVFGPVASQSRSEADSPLKLWCIVPRDVFGRLNFLPTNGVFRIQPLKVKNFEQSRKQPRNLECKFSRLQSMAQLEVDEEVLRGIPLQHTLRVGMGRWSSPTEMSHEKRGALYEKSRPTRHFDTFFSHTWLTKGPRKYVALLFHNGWPVMVASWVLATVVLSILCLTDVLPMPFSYQATVLDYRQTCPLGCWVIALSLPLAVAGLLLAPYCPNQLGKHRICFVDMFSIHQTDNKLRERGIYGIGGCLQRSKELRVLWSPPYFSRLWCIFELAAYRFANPQGKITMAPLFVESILLTLLVGIQVSMDGSFVGTALRSRGEYKALHTVLTSLFCTLPLLGIIHVLRKETRAKRQLLLDLESFTLDGAECASDFDRAFILSAIDQWYGSAEAFAKYVRGPLRTELLQNNAATVPPAYLMTCVVSLASIHTELFLALVKGGAPLKCILTLLMGLMVGTVAYQLTCFKLMLELSERLAEPCHAILDPLQTFFIWLATWVLLVLGVSATLALLSRPNVLPLALLVVVECLVFLASFGHLKRFFCLARSARDRI